MNSENPGELSIKEFSYPLPDERIARFPLEQRDHSKLLVYRGGQLHDARFYELHNWLNPGDRLVFNQSKVVRARLIFFSQSGARIELFCLGPADEQMPVPEWMQSLGSTRVACMIGNARKWKESEVLRGEFETSEGWVQMEARKLPSAEGGFFAELNWNPANLTFAAVLEAAGKLPLPPYLRREAEASDNQRYQTVYARHEGSVAAPTAGLHFTEQVFAHLRQKNVGLSHLTLHVGAGTFLPVKAETMKDHDMHAEELHVQPELFRELASTEGRLVTVGTTSIRTLESLYLTGLKWQKEGFRPEVDVKQWDGMMVRTKTCPPAREVFAFMAGELEREGLPVLSGHTRLIILPGYPIQTADALITNFHQPESTLLLLISCFIGDQWRKVYAHALENDYRFLSYGDSSLLCRY